MKQVYLVLFTLVMALGIAIFSLYPPETRKDIVLSEPQLTGVGGVLHKTGAVEESKDVPETTVDASTGVAPNQDVMLVNIPNVDISVCYLAVAGECAFGYSGTQHEIMIKREVFHRGDVPKEENPH